MNFPRGWGGGYHFIGEEVDTAWFDRYLNNRENAVRCVIADAKTDRVVGCTYLLNIDYINRCADFHIMIGEVADRGMGAGRFALRQMIHHSFHDLNLRRLSLEVLDENSAAQKLYTQEGFIKEGIIREAVYKNGVYHDLIIMGLLRSEYKNIS